MELPRSGSSTSWKTSHGPAKSIMVAPSWRTTATRILPVAGGVSFLAIGVPATTGGASDARKIVMAKAIEMWGDMKPPWSNKLASTGPAVLNEHNLHPPGSRRRHVWFVQYAAGLS